MSTLPEILERLEAKGLIEFDETGTKVRCTDAGAEKADYGELIEDILDDEHTE